MKTNRFTLGILAPVDAGKTTLAEALLYQGGNIRTLGRVDHRDALFDYYQQERERGITIFSKCAQLTLGRKEVSLLDTPGHADFSAEMERALSVMDYAVLVISGTDGVQSHTHTLFSLLRRYHVPAFLFVNKMDRPEADREAVSRQLKSELQEACVDITGYRDRLENDEAFREEIALCDEALTERYLSGAPIGTEDLRQLISGEKLYPCLFGSAREMRGIRELMDALEELSVSPDYPEEFGGRIYKVARDEKGSRVTWLKVTGGSLKVRQEVTGTDGTQAKIHQIRIYSGGRYDTVSEVPAGTVCGVTGPETAQAGQGLGFETEEICPELVPVFAYSVLPPEGTDMHRLFLDLRQMTEEEPDLAAEWKEQTQEILLRLMGEVQIEVLQQEIEDRFGIRAELGEGTVVYQETVAEPVIGIGHYEPLRHYAEVHIRIEPGERGSGLTFANECPEELLDRGWQHTAMTCLMETGHTGVLTGSALTDVKLTLISGKAHKAHSQGADFREAVNRAVRQGLMKADSVLLEPMYAYELTVPDSQVGRAMTDLNGKGADVAPPRMTEGQAVFSGRIPVSEVRGYGMEVLSYTGGKGQFSVKFDGYEVCHNTAEVLAACAYSPERDREHPSGSVFCRRGAGIFVPWDETDAWASVPPETGGNSDTLPDRTDIPRGSAEPGAQGSGAGGGFAAASEEDRELQAIFERTYGGANRQKSKNTVRSAAAVYPSKREKEKKPEASYLLVDGYNIIFSWEELKGLARVNLDAAREQLMDIMSNYAGYRRDRLILVFDAYKVKGGTEHVTRYHNIDVVYTREAETADAYIERVTRSIGEQNDVTVATSDGLEQMIIWGHGAKRMSAPELKSAVEDAGMELRAYMREQRGITGRLFDDVSDRDARYLENIRLGRIKPEEE
jgi:ribosomal protection tetracycline resistance protein